MTRYAIDQILDRDCYGDVFALVLMSQIFCQDKYLP